MRNLNEPKQGFWGSLARKAKSILDDDNEPQQSDAPGRSRAPIPAAETRGKVRFDFRLMIHGNVNICM